MKVIIKYLDMGGHAAFVWPALGITALVILVMTVTSLRSLRTSERALRAAEKQAPQRRARAQVPGADA